MDENNDLNRMRKEYDDRYRRLAGKNFYSLFSTYNLFMFQNRQRAVLKCLSSHGFNSLSDINIIEVGCGSGQALLEFVAWGADPCRTVGLDLLFNRLSHSQRRSSNLTFTCANGENLPYPAHTFDLAYQFTAFSSILDDEIKQNIACEMLRILKPGGLILWYDFWLNLPNRQTKGITPTEIRRLFPNCKLQFRKITLAPPLARKVVPASWLLAQFLENLKIFNTHYLAAIQPESV